MKHQKLYEYSFILSISFSFAVAWFSDIFGGIAMLLANIGLILVFNMFYGYKVIR